jgi:5-methylcytosine-specific restriction enzyme A
MGKNTKPCENKRSDKWPAVRKAYLKDHPNCVVCGGTKKIEVHHQQPFHLHPALELDPSNFISLCEGAHDVNCHLFVGHLGNFKGYNPDVEKDAEEWAKKLQDNKARIKETEKVQ